MGVKQWLFQRLCNLVFIIFGIWLLINLMDGSTTTLVALLADNTTRLFLAIVLVLAGINSILAGWQIAGDYAHKINVNQNILVALCTVVSLAYIVVGLQIIF